MDDLEERLNAWGSAWRAQQEVRVAGFVSPRAVPRFQAARNAARSIAAVLAVSVVIIGAVALRGVASRQAALPAGAANTDLVSPGDHVQAAGAIVAQTNGALLVCLAKGNLLTTLDAVGCSDVAVPLRGIDPKDIPGWTSENGVSFALNVTVSGVWTNGGIDVQNVWSGMAPDDPPIPCASVVGSVPPAGLAGEAAMARLEAVVDANPSEYGGLWSAKGQDGTLIAVVGVVRSVASAEPGLTATYPYALCLAAVERSLAELRTAAADLERSHPQWLPTVDPARNRVAIVLSVLDPESMSQVSSLGDGVYIRSLVRQLTAP